MEREDVLALIEALIDEAIDAGDEDALVETEAFAVLALGWVDAAEESREAVAAAVAEDDPTPARLEAAVSVAMGAAFAASVASGLFQVLRRGYRRARMSTGDGGDGAGGLPTILPLPEPNRVQLLATLGGPDVRALSTLHEQSMHYVRSHYGEDVSARVREVAASVLGRGLSRQAAGEVFARELDPVYGQSLAYWRLHAAATMARAQEFGRISGYETLGLVEVYWSSVRDRRTTPQCDYLHGRPIDVEVLASTRDAVLRARTPEAQKDAAPWMTEAEVRTLVEAKGGRIPTGVMSPLHGHCRSRTVTTPPPGAAEEVVALYRNQLLAA